MVMLDRKEDQRVVNTAICVGKIQLAHGKRLMSLFGVFDDFCQLMMVLHTAWCLGMNAFCTDLSRYWFAIMKDNHLLRTMVVNNFPMHDVSAMGLKLDGSVGSFSAAGFPSNFTEAVFHCAGMRDCIQQVLKRSCSAFSKAGHLLNTTYGTPSSGEGDDLVLDLLTAAEISSNEISPQLNSFVGSGG